MQELSDDAIFPVPQFSAEFSDLVMLADEPDLCTDGLAEIREQLGVDAAAALCIKPLDGGASVGVMRLDTPEQLYLYARAVRDEWPIIPADAALGAPPPLQRRAHLSVQSDAHTFVSLGELPSREEERWCTCR